MHNIQPLDQGTINKIAAGEVIERPSSVVKELLENAIDAKATAVTVEIRDGGISFIRVTDNGQGIPADEMPLAFLRHSTSKIRSAEDLFHVSSLGFRGEALSSIAAVSQVEVISRTPASLTGLRYEIEGGCEKAAEEIGAPEGTTFIVRNLFYNTPVRKKFLKTAATEGAYIGDLVEKIALSHPEVSVRFIQNNQNKLHTSGNHNLKDIIYAVFGRDIALSLLAIKKEGPALSVEGFIGKPSVARNNRNFENYFINGRYIKSNLISRAIEEAYRPFMMQHKYPFTLLHLALDPKLLDVNVHPAKREVRFQDERTLYQEIYDALSEALAHKELIPQVELDEKERREKEKRDQQQLKQERRAMPPEPFEKKRMSQSCLREPQGRQSQVREQGDLYGGSKQEPIRELEQRFRQEPKREFRQEPIRELEQRFRQEPKQEFRQEPIRELEQRFRQEPKQEFRQEPKREFEQEPEQGLKQLDLFEEQLLAPQSRSRHKLIGQLFSTYWLVEFNNQLYIIDQHAAHEKVLYEQVMASMASRSQTSQMVAPPIILSLSGREEALLTDHLPAFERLGFVIEHFGGREYAVRGVPDNLFSLAQKDLLIGMLDELSEESSLAANPAMIEEKIASISCKAAVKGNHRMSVAEADHLIDQLLLLENPYTCPHGRPTIISMSKQEMEKKFKRIVT